MARVSPVSKALPNADAAIETALNRFASQTAFTISSTREPDMPIIYVSSEFCKMTGYSEQDILGRNCRFLQGPGTSRQSVQEIRNCIQEDRGCTVCLMNYTKDGKAFWNQLCLAPVRDEFGVACYLGIQTNVTGAVLAFRSQQFSPSQTRPAGPHGGVHSFTCPEIVAKEIEDARKLEGTIRRWHSEKLDSISVCPFDFRPVSSKSLPASLLSPLYKMQQSYVLADPNLPDMPIVHASEGFLRLTGRPRDQVVGHNCRFMQGPQTDKTELRKLSHAIKEERPITVRLLNYRTDGDMFWNNLHVAPIRDANGKVVFFVGCQLDITLKQARPQRRHSDVTGDPMSQRSKIQATQGNNSQDRIPEGEVHNETLASVNNEPTLQCAAEMSAEGESKKSNLLAILHGDQALTEKHAQESQPLQEGGTNASITRDASLAGTKVEVEGQSACQRSKALSEAQPGAQAVPEAKQLLSPSARQQQRSIVGTVRVVCRSLSSKCGLRRSLEDQHLPHGIDDCAKPDLQGGDKGDDSSATNINVPSSPSCHS